MKDNVTKENWVGTSLHDWEIFLLRGGVSVTKNLHAPNTLTNRYLKDYVKVALLFSHWQNCWAWRSTPGNFGNIFSQPCRNTKWSSNFRDCDAFTSNFAQSRIILFHIELKACEWTRKDLVDFFMNYFPLVVKFACNQNQLMLQGTQNCTFKASMTYNNKSSFKKTRLFSLTVPWINS